MLSVLNALILKPTADTGFVFVRRLNGSMEKIPFSEAQSTQVGDNDIIIIPAQRQLSNVDTALVTGEVLRPGTIPIQSGKTTVAEALELAGGGTSNGNLKQAYLLRREKMKNPGAEKNPGGSENVAAPLPLTVVRPEINSSMENLLASYDYAVLPLNGDGRNVLLEQGDEIHVPRQDKYVYLSGQVGLPGAYLFHSGWDVDDYVREAGGYTQKADPVNSYVVTYYDEAYQIKNPKSLQSGDIIVSFPLPCNTRSSLPFFFP